MGTNFPTVVTRSELKRIVWAISSGASSQRVGQAVANYYNLPKDVEDAIWEDNNFGSVVEKLYNWIFS